MIPPKSSLKTNVVPPNLIQRCKITNPPSSGKGLSDCLSFDYMGSAEFEWGALPKNTEALYFKRDRLKIFRYEGPTPAGIKRLFFLCVPEQAEDYYTQLQALCSNQIRTKEFVFSIHKPKETNLWFDLDNQVVFSTDHGFLSKLTLLLQVSMDRILKSRAVRKRGDELINSGLRDLHHKLDGMVALCPHDIDDCPGTKTLKSQTKESVVFWLNGPQVNDEWVCGFYTAEAVQEFIDHQTGPIQNYIQECESKKRRRS